MKFGLYRLEHIKSFYVPSRSSHRLLEAYGILPRIHTDLSILFERRDYVLIFEIHEDSLSV